MSQLTPARRTLAILALALGGFAIGTTEFVAMGLLPNIAEALLPGQYAADPEGGVAHAGWLVSAYALGVVVGAPTIAAMSAKFPRKGLLMVLLVGFAVATVASAVLPSFGLVLVARFVAGLPHGAYFGIASIVAGDIMGPGKRGKGIALVLLGLSVANVVGVPAVTWIGQVASWRIAYGVVAALFVLTFFAVSFFVPRSGRDVHATIGRELRAFRVPQVWIVMSLAQSASAGSSPSTRTSRRSCRTSPGCRSRRCRWCSSWSGSAWSSAGCSAGSWPTEVSRPPSSSGSSRWSGHCS